MSSPFIDQTALSLSGPRAVQPADLPHGLIAPPDRVREIAAQEEERLSREKRIAPSAEARRRMIDDLTLQFHFDALGHEVLYRSTPAGPEVLAVGLDEILAFRKGMSLEEQLQFNTWLT
jgi:hypothetical protein